MRRALLIPFVLMLALAGACNQADTAAAGDDSRAESPAVAAKDLSPEDLGKLGAELKKNPDRAEQILSERGLDQQTFEKEIRKVSEDPEASKRYAAAYKEASA
ncbi:MAG TPA: hypothetical protein VFV54_07355 [Thermoanaerobaculia bacterium]|nr:hypothetical protein [Thermoanaerobaculia bacterium]